MVKLKSRWMPETDCRLEWGHYVENGWNSLVISDSRTGEPLLKASVNPFGTDKRPVPQDSLIYIKNWDGNEGILESLIDAGVLEDTGGLVSVGMMGANLARIRDRDPDSRLVLKKRLEGDAVARDYLPRDHYGPAYGLRRLDVRVYSNDGQFMGKAHRAVVRLADLEQNRNPIFYFSLSEDNDWIPSREPISILTDYIKAQSHRAAAFPDVLQIHAHATHVWAQPLGTSDSEADSEDVPTRSDQPTNTDSEPSINVNSTRVANPSEELKRMYDVQDALSHTQLRLNALINKAEAEHNARSFIAGSTIESDL